MLDSLRIIFNIFGNVLPVKLLQKLFDCLVYFEVTIYTTLLANVKITCHAEREMISQSVVFGEFSTKGRKQKILF